jgi:hypothetical protein
VSLSPGSWENTKHIYNARISFVWIESETREWGRLSGEWSGKWEERQAERAGEKEREREGKKGG